MSGTIRPLPPFMAPGWSAKIGEHRFDADEIIAFARLYDPHPFHLSEEGARDTVFGALCASGWHTAAMWMRKQREFMAAHGAELASEGYLVPEFGPSPGFSNLRWLKPVYAGQLISFHNRTVSCRLSASRPGWHVLVGEYSARNAEDETVMQFESTVFLHLP